MKTKNKISAYILPGSTAALLFSCVIVALCSAINLPHHPPKALPPRDNAAFGANAHGNRTLSFADRVAYQSAIEDVYWRHRIWPDMNSGPKPSLDAVMSQAQLERKVEDYLGNSQALEDYWQRPITADQLQAEMERMASHTKQPEVLRELFEALGNDPFVIAECLARPVLTQRLVTELKNEERVELTTVAWLRDPLQSGIATAETQAPKEVAAIDSIAKAVQVNRPYQLPVIARPSGVCTDDTWTPTTLTNAPSARRSHAAVWTGTEMIVWGGFNGTTQLNTGGRYNPSTDSWTATSTTNAPSPRESVTAVWTGSEMIVWGGNAPGAPFNTGGRYDPSTDSWTATSTTNAPSPRLSQTAVWTGSEMILWGGFNGFSFLNTGGRYDPDTDSWTATSTTDAPSPRSSAAVWTGSEMIVWNGGTGGRYDPNTDSWTATSTTNAPTGGSAAAWTGSEMIVYNAADTTGGRYDPDTDSWTATSTTNAPSARSQHSTVWTGSEMIVWGGLAVGPTFLNTGGRYDPGTDSWTATSITDAPTGRRAHRAVWTGSEMIVWGGVNGTVTLNTGGRYCAQPGVCVFSQGFWKNHPEAWPVTELQLGNVTYNQQELLSIFRQPVRGNGLVLLAHQLITAKLNIANGADGSCIHQTLADAGSLIGDLVVPPVGNGYLQPRDVAGIAGVLGSYNEGNLCAPSCDNGSLSPRQGATALHHYTFDGFGVVDSVGTANGTLLNGASVSAGQLHLDGVDDYVQFDEHIVPTVGDFSIVWGGVGDSGYLNTGAAAPSPTPTPTCAPPPPNMVSWWPGDGNADDIIDGNNGILHNGATFATGMVDQAFLLDGIDDFVDVGNAPNLHVSQGEFTVDAWVNFNALRHPPDANNGPPPGDMSILDKMSPSGVNTDGWRLIKQDDNRFWFCFGDVPGNGCNPSSPTTVVSTTIATTGTWFHIAAVKSAAEIAIYVNGVNEASKPTPTFTDTHSANLFIGANALYPAYLDGLVDEVEIFNRALSASEIQAIVNAGSAGKCKPTPTPTPTPSPTPTATATPTATPTVTPTATPSATPRVTPRPRPTPHPRP